MVLEGQECRGALVGVLFAIFLSGIALALLSRSLLIGVLFAAVGLWAWVWFSIVTGWLAGGEWPVMWIFNRYHEGWPEMILIPLAFALSVTALVGAVRKQ